MTSRVYPCDIPRFVHAQFSKCQTCQDRSFRIGQTRVVEVLPLLSEFCGCMKKLHLLYEGTSWIYAVKVVTDALLKEILPQDYAFWL